MEGEVVNEGERVVDAYERERPDDPGQYEVDQALTLVPRQQGREVLRPLDGAALAESFDEYQRLLPTLLKANDYQDAGRGQRFVKKSGWRKIATAFGLSVVRVAEEVERDDDGKPIRAKAIYRAVAPNGRAMDGDGYCSVDESRFRDASGRKKLENDLRATATTRAKNRAISDLVGMGEVSAEEVDGGNNSGPQHGRAATNPQAIGCGNALSYILGSAGLDPAEADILHAKIEESYGYIPAASAEAIILVAKHIKGKREETS